MELLRKYLTDHNIINGRQLTAAVHRDAKLMVIESTKFLDDHYTSIPMAVRLQCIISGIDSIPTCLFDGCGGFVSIVNSHFGKFCSVQCGAKYRGLSMLGRNKESNPEFYEHRSRAATLSFQNRAKSLGFEDWESYTHSSMFPDIVNKRKQTHIKNTGVSNNMKCPVGLKVWKDSFFDKYGVTSPTQLPEFNFKANWDFDNDCWYTQTEKFKNTARATTLSRYGVTHASSHPMVKEKAIQTNLSRYGRISPNQVHIPTESLDILMDKDRLSELVKSNCMSTVGDMLGVHYSSVQRACALLDIPTKKSTSQGERDVAIFVESLGFLINRNVYFKECKREADIVIESLKLIIEFNGVYWHCDDFKNPTYHQQKTLSFLKLGYSTLHIWEDDWDNPIKREIILNKIRSKLGVPSRRTYARKCDIMLCTRLEVVDFYENNHIQGHVNGSYYIGLKLDGVLVGCMTFNSKGDGVYDLSRFATSINVVGGASRCLSFFKRTVAWSHIFTFASLDYSSGNVYDRLGFVKRYITDPNMWYMKRGQWIRLGRRRFIKSKLPRILDIFDESLSEKENMHNNDYVRIFDCGSIKYTMDS